MAKLLKEEAQATFAPCINKYPGAHPSLQILHPELSVPEKDMKRRRLCELVLAEKLQSMVWCLLANLGRKRCLL